MMTTVKLLSTDMCYTPSLLRWAIEGYKFKRDRPKFRRVLTAGFGLTAKCADDLLSGRVPFTVDEGHVLFEYDGKARRKTG